MAEEGQVIACHTVDTWKEHFEKGKGSQKLVFASLFEPFSICVCEDFTCVAIKEHLCVFLFYT